MERLNFDLSNPLSCNAEMLSNLFKCHLRPSKSKSHFDYIPFFILETG